ncbi:hypothetical protein MASR2M78_35680 [Treponema sp.]
MNKNIFHLNLGALLRHTASMVCTLIILGCPNDMASPLLETIEQRVAATKIGTLASPVLSLPEGTYSGAQLIAISCSTPGAKLRYTLDGTNPTATKGVLYTMPVGIDSTKTLKVVSFLESGAVSSVVSAEFRITIPQTDKAIVAFSILSTSGIIDELAKTITLSLPYGSVLTDLVAQFTLSASYCKINSTIQESGFTHNDFTKPVVYRVYAEDNSTADYTVTVTVALNPAKELLSFSIKDCDDVATINQETGSITMSLPYGTLFELDCCVPD